MVPMVNTVAIKQSDRRIFHSPWNRKRGRQALYHDFSVRGIALGVITSARAAEAG
jgi:hypothetical protein